MPEKHSSPDGRISFILNPAGSGVRVQRHEVRTRAEGGGFALFETVFTSHEAFQRFQAQDPSRFTYPLLHDLVQRKFSRLFTRPAN